MANRAALVRALAAAVLLAACGESAPQGKPGAAGARGNDAAPAHASPRAPAPDARRACISSVDAGSFAAAIRPCLDALAAAPNDPEVLAAVRRIQGATADAIAAERAAAERAVKVEDNGEAAAGNYAAPGDLAAGAANGVPAAGAVTPTIDAAAAEAARKIAERLSAFDAAVDEAAKRALGR